MDRKQQTKRTRVGKSSSASSSLMTSFLRHFSANKTSKHTSVCQLEDEAGKSPKQEPCTTMANTMTTRNNRIDVCKTTNLQNKDDNNPDKNNERAETSFSDSTRLTSTFSTEENDSKHTKRLSIESSSRWIDVSDRDAEPQRKRNGNTRKNSGSCFSALSGEKKKNENAQTFLHPSMKDSNEKCSQSFRKKEQIAPDKEDGTVCFDSEEEEHEEKEENASISDSDEEHGLEDIDTDEEEEEDKDRYLRNYSLALEREGQFEIAPDEPRRASDPSSYSSSPKCSVQSEIGKHMRIAAAAWSSSSSSSSSSETDEEEDSELDGLIYSEPDRDGEEEYLVQDADNDEYVGRNVKVPKDTHVTTNGGPRSDEEISFACNQKKTQGNRSIITPVDDNGDEEVEPTGMSSHDPNGAKCKTTHSLNCSSFGSENDVEYANAKHNKVLRTIYEQGSENVPPIKRGRMHLYSGHEEDQELAASSRGNSVDHQKKKVNCFDVSNDTQESQLHLGSNKNGHKNYLSEDNKENQTLRLCCDTQDSSLFPRNEGPKQTPDPTSLPVCYDGLRVPDRTPTLHARWAVATSSSSLAKQSRKRARMRQMQLPFSSVSKKESLSPSQTANHCTPSSSASHGIHQNGKENVGGTDLEDEDEYLPRLPACVSGGEGPIRSGRCPSYLVPSNVTAFEDDIEDFTDDDGENAAAKKGTVFERSRLRRSKQISRTTRKKKGSLNSQASPPRTTLMGASSEASPSGQATTKETKKYVVVSRSSNRYASGHHRPSSCRKLQNSDVAVELFSARTDRGIESTKMSSNSHRHDTSEESRGSWEVESQVTSKDYGHTTNPRSPTVNRSVTTEAGQATTEERLSRKRPQNIHISRPWPTDRQNRLRQAATISTKMNGNLCTDEDVRFFKRSTSGKSKNKHDSTTEKDRSLSSSASGIEVLDLCDDEEKDTANQSLMEKISTCAPTNRRRTSSSAKPCIEIFDTADFCSSITQNEKWKRVNDETWVKTKSDSSIPGNHVSPFFASTSLNSGRNDLRGGSGTGVGGVSMIGNNIQSDENCTDASHVNAAGVATRSKHDNRSKAASKRSHTKTTVASTKKKRSSSTATGGGGRRAASTGKKRKYYRGKKSWWGKGKRKKGSYSARQNTGGRNVWSGRESGAGSYHQRPVKRGGGGGGYMEISKQDGLSTFGGADITF